MPTAGMCGSRRRFLCLHHVAARVCNNSAMRAQYIVEEVTELQVGRAAAGSCPSDARNGLLRRAAVELERTSHAVPTHIMLGWIA